MRGVCDLCDTAVSTPDRSCGLDLCRACVDDDPSERVAARGFVIETEQWSARPSREHAPMVHHTRVTGRVAMAAVPAALFTREHVGDRLLKWLGRKEVQAGDSLFDDAIFIDTSTPELIRQLLGDEGLQMVIMEAVLELRQIVFEQVDGACQVRVHTSFSSSRHEQPTSHQRIVAIALHCLTRSAAAEPRQ